MNDRNDMVGIFCGDPEVDERVRRVLVEEAGVSEERLHKDWEALDGSELVVVHQDVGEEAEKAGLFSREDIGAICLSHRSDKENINEILARQNVNHLIGMNSKDPYAELAVTAKKMLSRDIWGLDKYFGAEATFVSGQIVRADQIDETIESMLESLDLSAYFSASHEFLRMTANEFCTNAVYNAPVDDQGNPKYESTDRKTKIKLAEHEYVMIDVASDQERVAISVTDRFGRLGREKIVRHLVKCVNNTQFVENKAGGAGAGIYLAFYTANQFIINVRPGERLEIICILERNKRYKEYRNRITSFHYFTSGGAA